MGEGGKVGGRVVGREGKWRVKGKLGRVGWREG